MGARLTRGYVVAVVGAESTGKTTLARALADRLVVDGHDAVVVAEHLREWCERAGRTPRADEQRAIAAEQTARIDAAASAHEIVVADTTALMTAVYSDLLFDDRSLDDDALAAHARCDVTLLTALDLPWVADPAIRDGAHVRVPVDTRVRAALQRAGLGYAVVSGHGEARVEAALAAVRAARRPRSDAGWRWVCEHCDDGTCERHAAARLFSSLHRR